VEDRRIQTGWDAAEALAMIDAARESAARHRWVEVDEIRQRSGLDAQPNTRTPPMAAPTETLTPTLQILAPFLLRFRIQHQD
jgi:hypothetical protein